MIKFNAILHIPRDDGNGTVPVELGDFTARTATTAATMAMKHYRRQAWRNTPYAIVTGSTLTVQGGRLFVRFTACSNGNRGQQRASYTA